MWFREIFGGSTAPKYLTDWVPSNIWGLYTPKIFDGWGSVKYLGAVHPQIISQNAGAHYALAVGAGVAGVGTRHQPHRTRSCELALRALGAV